VLVTLCCYGQELCAKKLKLKFKNSEYKLKAMAVKGQRNNGDVALKEWDFHLR
jgi:hypothetical protein